MTAYDFTDCPGMIAAGSLISIHLFLHSYALLTVHCTQQCT